MAILISLFLVSLCVIINLVDVNVSTGTRETVNNEDKKALEPASAFALAASHAALILLQPIKGHACTLSQRHFVQAPSFKRADCRRASIAAYTTADTVANTARAPEGRLPCRRWRFWSRQEEEKVSFQGVRGKVVDQDANPSVSQTKHHDQTTSNNHKGSFAQCSSGCR